MRDAQAEMDAELLQDRFELLRLRTLFVGGLGVLVFIFSLVALLGFGSRFFSLLGQVLTTGNDGFHVPGNLFQKPADAAWSRTPALLQIAFVVVGISGISYMTRQVLSSWQVRAWLAVLVLLSLSIIYTQSDVGSVWHSSQRVLVKAVHSKEWSVVEQLSSTSQNTLAHNYVMAQVGLIKPDNVLLQLHGKELVDKVDDLVMRRGLYAENMDSSSLKVADEFKPHILKMIDVSIYGAAHTQIGISLEQPNGLQKHNSPSRGWTMARSLLEMLGALAGIGVATALFFLWRLMARRLRWLRPWIMAAGQ
jgi:hypothetical protein